MTQDLKAGSIGPNTTMSHFATNAYGQPWTMSAPLIEDGFANATIPQLNMYGNSSVPSIPHIRGGYTSFLLVEYKFKKNCIPVVLKPKFMFVDSYFSFALYSIRS